MTSGARSVSKRTTSVGDRCSLRFVRQTIERQRNNSICNGQKRNSFSNDMISSRITFALVATVLCSIIGCEAIRCYQCSSDTDPKGQDLCGAYNKFDTYKNSPIECNHQDSKTPGTFCVKITKQSPRGFIWDGRWRQVIRRCASVATTGVTGVCNWGVEENGVYWEECSCSNDSCNGSTTLFATSTIFVTALGLLSSLLWT